MKNKSKNTNENIDGNPFATKTWIKQGYSFTQHRRDQTELLLSKTVEEIRSLDRNDGAYPAFVAIRLGYAAIKDNRLVPTDRWSKW